VQDLVPACIEHRPTNVIIQYQIGVWLRLVSKCWTLVCSFCTNNRHPLSGGEINSVSTKEVGVIGASLALLSCNLRLIWVFHFYVLCTAVRRTQAVKLDIRVQIYRGSYYVSMNDYFLPVSICKWRDWMDKS